MAGATAGHDLMNGGVTGVASPLANVQAKKKPRPKARQFIREETPRKGRGVSDASQRQSRVRRTIDQAKNACVGRENARNIHLSGIINALIARLS
jgi:hypothetical protein